MKCKGILCKFIGGRLLIHIQVKDTVLLTKLFCAISKLWSIDSVRNIFLFFQIILSFILRHRLGGKGYQPDPSNPILQQVKPLGEFVDSIMKLQNIVEEVTDPRLVHYTWSYSESLG